MIRTLEKQSASVQSSLRIIYETPETSPHPVAAHARVPVAVRERIKEALFDMRNSEQGRALLKGVLLSEPVAADYSRDYAPLKSLNVEKYIEM